MIKPDTLELEIKFKVENNYKCLFFHHKPLYSVFLPPFCYRRFMGYVEQPEYMQNAFENHCSTQYLPLAE